MIIDINGILQLLPHRYPMLLVDRVEIIEQGHRCKGYKNVTINEPFFNGHYPRHPIMPGVLILEAMAQVGAVLLLSDPRFKDMAPLIGAIEGVKFRRPVVPGDRLDTEITVMWVKGTVGKCLAVGTVDGDSVATFEMIFKIMSLDPV